MRITRAICEKILGLAKNYNQVLIYNGFTQKKIKTEYLLRPINPKDFLKLDDNEVERVFNKILEGLK